MSAHEQKQATARMQVWMPGNRAAVINTLTAITASREGLTAFTSQSPAAAAPAAFAASLASSQQQRGCCVTGSIMLQF